MAHVQEAPAGSVQEAVDWKSMDSDIIRPRGVTVSTLDSESSDRGSNPREASALLPLFYGRHELEVSRTLPASGFAFCPCGLEALGVGYFNRHLD